jgi:hypothetical protein
MPQLNDLSRSLVALDQDSTIIAVVELRRSDARGVYLDHHRDRQEQFRVPGCDQGGLRLVNRRRRETHDEIQVRIQNI